MSVTRMNLAFNAVCEKEASGLNMGVINCSESLNSTEKLLFVGEDDNFIHCFSGSSGEYCGITKGSDKYKEILALN